MWKSLERRKTKDTETIFKPDHEIFDTLEFQANTLKERLRELAFLNRGVRIRFKDLRTVETETPAETETDAQDEKSEVVYHYEGGIASFVKYQNEKPRSSPYYPYLLRRAGR